MLQIIDYGMGNVRSVYNAFRLLGEDVVITDDPSTLSNAEAIILPGVGSFSNGMKNLKEMGIFSVLEKEILDNKKPYLGICLGLEFLAKQSNEGGLHEGFGWVDSIVTKIEPNDPKLKIPHMGWDDTEILKNDGLLKEFDNPTFYYLHSYYFKVNDPERDYVTSICNYGGVPITATFHKENLYAVQFHPEKSQTTGLKLLKNFLDDIRK